MTEPLHVRIAALLSDRLPPLLGGFAPEHRNDPATSINVVSVAQDLLREALPIVTLHEARKVAAPEESQLGVRSGPEPSRQPPNPSKQNP